MSDDTKKRQTAGPTESNSKARSGSVTRTKEPKPTSPIISEGSAPDVQSVKMVSGKSRAAARVSATQSEEINASNKGAPTSRKRVVRTVPISDHEIKTTKPTRGEENSIEETVPRFLGPSTKPSNLGAAMAVDRSDVSGYVVSNISRVTRGVGAWLRNWSNSASPGDLDVSTAPAKGSASNNPRAATGATDAMSNAVPEAVSRLFLKVGQDYYFFDKTPAFSDQGTKLATRGANPDVIRSLVDIAIARGWDSVTLKGTKEFRRSAWLEAVQRGLKNVGYEPDPLDLAELANRPGSNSVGKSPTKEKIMPASPGPRPAVQANLDTPSIADNAPSRRVKSAHGTVVQDPEFIRKANAFERNKPAYVVKKYPDLVGAYGIVEAAKAFATERMPESVREEFVGIARQHVLQKITAGEVVKGPKVFLNRSKVVIADVPTKTPDTSVAKKTKEQLLKEVVRVR